MSSTPDLSVIIPVFNKWELTRECLRSLKENTQEYSFEVIVVDNASSDATATELLSLGEQLFGCSFRRIRFDENRNFGPACNVGAAIAEAPFVYFLNNDTLLTKGWAPPLLEALKGDPGLGGVGPLLLYEDGGVQHLGVAFNIIGVLHLYKNFPSEHPVVKKRRKFKAITGAAIILPTKLFLDSGGFYEEYRNGFEDIDLCLRIHSKGKYFSTIPESVVYHLESQTAGRSTYDAENSALLKERCGKFYQIDFHHFGADDGFEVFINDFFDLKLMHPRSESEALLRYAAGKPFHVWEKLLYHNPYWREGYELVADALEEQRQYDAALGLRDHVAFKFGLEDAYAKLMRCAIRAKNKPIQKKTEKYYRLLLSRKENRSFGKKLCRQWVEIAEQSGDDFLAGLYRKKLQNMSTVQ